MTSCGFTEVMRQATSRGSHCFQAEKKPVKPKLDVCS